MSKRRTAPSLGVLLLNSSKSATTDVRAPSAASARKAVGTRASATANAVRVQTKKTHRTASAEERKRHADLASAVEDFASGFSAEGAVVWVVSELRHFADTGSLKRTLAQRTFMNDSILEVSYNKLKKSISRADAIEKLIAAGLATSQSDANRALKRIKKKNSAKQ